jgi:hypothetical protein
VNERFDSIQPYLRPGEQLLWHGAPDPNVRFTPVDAYVIPFSIMWGGFTIFWEAGALSSGAPPFFVIWGIPFVGMGLYLTFGRFNYKRRRKLQTAYAVTDQRALVAVGSSTLLDSPVKYQPVTIKRSRDRRHVSAVVGSTGGWRGSTMYGNTGLDFFMRGNQQLAFYDVADGDAMVQALEKARAT